MHTYPTPYPYPYTQSPHTPLPSALFAPPPAGVVTLKGRAACEIDTADELLAAELLLNGTFGGLEPAALVALASCLVPVEKSTEDIKLTAAMAEPLAQLQVEGRGGAGGVGGSTPLRPPRPCLPVLPHPPVRACYFVRLLVPSFAQCSGLSCPPPPALQAAARHIAEVSRECKLEVDPDEYVDSFQPALMDVIYAWSKGASFAQVG